MFDFKVKVKVSNSSNSQCPDGTGKIMEQQHVNMLIYSNCIAH